MAGSFGASVTAWVAATRERVTAVRNESAQRVIARMQVPVGAGGNMPVDTGVLRYSLQVTLGGPQPATRPRPGGPHAFDANPAVLTINGAPAGTVIYACYTAAYAPHVNYGSNGRPGRLFVDLAAQAWPSIVSAVCAELQASAG